MLKKLLKYDLKYMYKTLSLFYIIAIISALMTNIMRHIEGGFIIYVLTFTAGFITIVMSILIVGYNVIKCWRRFLNNIYKDESYLTHTLPVSKTSIFTSKFFSALITLTSSILVIIICLFIAFYSAEFMELIKSSLDGLSDIYNSSLILFILVIFAILFLEIVAVVMAGYTGILLGHRCANNKLLLSVVIGYIISQVFSLIMLAIIFLVGFAIGDITGLFTETIPTLETIKSVLYSSFILYLVEVVVYYLLDLAIFKKGINVD